MVARVALFRSLVRLLLTKYLQLILTLSQSCRPCAEALRRNVRHDSRRSVHIIDCLLLNASRACQTRRAFPGVCSMAGCASSGGSTTTYTYNKSSYARCSYGLHTLQLQCFLTWHIPFPSHAHSKIQHVLFVKPMMVGPHAPCHRTASLKAAPFSSIMQMPRQRLYTSLITRERTYFVSLQESYNWTYTHLLL